MTTDTPSDDLVKRIETQIAMDSPRGREVYQEAADEINRLRAELAEAKREVQAWFEQSQKQCDLRTQAEAARDRFAAVIATGGVGVWRNEAIAHHRAKQEEKNRG